MTFRVAVGKDLKDIKAIADKNTRDIGFLARDAVREAIKKKWVLVATDRGKIVGFVRFRHRKDNVFKIYEICVAATHRSRSIGRGLIMMVKEIGESFFPAIELKCPLGGTANGFYKRLGFKKSGIVPGRKRKLVNWRFEI